MFFPDQYRYDSKLMQFDIRKIFNDIAKSADNYYLIAGGFFKRKYIRHHDFNIFELQFLLQDNINSLFHMTPFDFNQYVLHKPTCNIETVNYFRSHEILAGKTISDLFLKNPTVINNALKQNLEELRDTNSENMLEKLIEDKEPSVQKRLKEIGFF